MYTAAIASPNRIACIAPFRSEDRALTGAGGGEPIAWTKVVDLSD